MSVQKWLALLYLMHNFFTLSEVKLKVIWICSYLFWLFCTSFDCLWCLWLSSAVTQGLVLRCSIENCSNTENNNRAKVMFQFSLLFTAWGNGQQKIICKIHGENKKDLHKHVILEQLIVFFFLGNNVLFISGLTRNWKGERWLPQQYDTENTLLRLQRNWSTYFQPVLQVCNLIVLRQAIKCYMYCTC